MVNDEARIYFKTNGLSYKDIDLNALNILAIKLNYYLEKYRLVGGFHAEQMDMRLRPMTRLDKKFNKNGLVRARFLIDGSYFSKREGITFNEGGFIGFAGEFSTTNTQPILTAFIDWCDWLKNKKEAMIDTKLGRDVNVDN